MYFSSQIYCNLFKNEHFLETEESIELIPILYVNLYVLAFTGVVSGNSGC